MSDLIYTIVIPWSVNALVLMYYHSSANDKEKRFWKWTILFWLALLGLTLGSALQWNGNKHNSVDAVIWVLQESWDRTYEALTHILRYIIPFAVYPLIMFWLKIWVHRTQNHQEQAWFAGILNTQNIQKQRQQAQLITFVLKVLILVFVFFDLLGKLDIQTDRVLQIGTVFSLGLSWSMRDWLSSLWASFMIAFTTELTCDSLIALGANSEVAVEQMLRVIRPGLIYTVCTLRVQSDDIKQRAEAADKNVAAIKRGISRSTDFNRVPLKLIFIPNSTLVSQGFVVLHTPN